jgi:hypothetical protein
MIKGIIYAGKILSMSKYPPSVHSRRGFIEPSDPPGPLPRGYMYGDTFLKKFEKTAFFA